MGMRLFIAINFDEDVKDKIFMISKHRKSSSR